MRRNLKLALILSIFLIILSTFALSDNCADVITNSSLGIPSVATGNNINCVMPLATYHINASSTIAAIRIGASGGITANNYTLDFNGSTLIGNGTGDCIKAINIQNVKITNAIIIGCNQNVVAQRNSAGDKNFTITNSILINATTLNLFIANLNYSLVDNVTSYGSGISHGLYVSYDASMPSSVGFTNGIIRNSRFYNNGKNGIQFNSAGKLDSDILYWQVYNNEIYGNTQNGINQLACSFCNFTNNSIHDNIGQAIAFSFNADAGIAGYNTSGKNTLFVNNTLYGNSKPYYIGNLTYNNLLTNNNYQDGKGLITLLDDFNFTMIEPNLQIVNLSYVYTNSRVIISYSGLKNFSVVNNTVSLNPISAGNYSAYWTHNNTIAFNNLATATISIPTNGALTINLASSAGGCDYLKNPFSIYANTNICNVSYLYFNFTNTVNYKYFKTTIALNISLFNLTDQGYPYVSIFLSNQTTPIVENVNEYNLTLAPNNRSFVFSYLTATEPKFSSIGTGITAISNLNSDASDFSFTYTGTGTISLTNLNGITIAYRVYKDGVLIETTTSRDYNVTSAGTWNFSSILNYKVSGIEQKDCYSWLQPLIDMGNLFPMIIIVLMIILLVPIFLAFGSKNNNAIDVAKSSTDSYLYVIIGIGAILIFLILLFYIGINLVQTSC